MDKKTVATSFLSLNEYCLLKIFKFLKFPDLVNLNITCKKFKFIGTRVCAQKYKQIEVQIDKNKGMNQIEFTNALSVIGEHIASVSVDGGNQLILQLIKDKCKNINSLELWNCKGPIELQCFANLKELKLNAVPISSNELRCCFEKNAELECLEYDCSHGEGFLEFVDMLPKLRSLHLHNVPNSLHQNLHCLDGLTKFSFFSLENCNQLLMELTNNSQLKELRVWMRLDNDTFDIIKSFRNLEALSMHQFGPNENLPETMVFPPTLKTVKMTGVKLSYKTMLSTVQQLKSLDEFDLGYQHDHDKSLYFNDRTVVTEIELGLKAELTRRPQPLNIIYFDCQSANKQLYIHCSHKLHIINSCAADDRPESEVITVASPV